VKKTEVKKWTLETTKSLKVRYRGLQTCVAEAQVIKCDLIYISFDVDSMDCDMISWYGNSRSKGFDQHEVIAIINQIIKSKKLFVLKLWRPLGYKRNKMAETAFEVLEQITSTVIFFTYRIAF
jgi:arginase